MPYFLKLSFIATAMVLPLAVFVWWRIWAIFRPFSSKKYIYLKKGLGYLLLSFLAYPLYGVIWHYGGMEISYNNQELWLSVYFWFGMVLITQLFWCLLLFIIIHLILRFGMADFYQRIKSRLVYIRVGVVVFVVFFVGVKSIIDFSKIIVEEAVEVEITGLTGNEEIRIVHISDLQADELTNEKKMLRYINLVNDQNPDVVIFSGDLITEGVEYIPIAAEMLGKIQSANGVFSVFGDHDIWTGSQLASYELEEEGIVLLDNQNEVIEIKGLKIRISGITEAYSRRVSSQVLDTVLSDSTDADVKILMSHQPSERLAASAKDYGYDLFLAGHTHGGQIVLPFFFYDVNPANMETKYAAGNYREENFLVNVNSGLGSSLAPIRYNAPASISTILLVPPE